VLSSLWVGSVCVCESLVSYEAVNTLCCVMCVCVLEWCRCEAAWPWRIQRRILRSNVRQHRLCSVTAFTLQSAAAHRCCITFLTFLLFWRLYLLRQLLCGIISAYIVKLSLQFLRIIIAELTVLFCAHGRQLCDNLYSCRMGFLKVFLVIYIKSRCLMC